MMKSAWPIAIRSRSSPLLQHINQYAPYRIIGVEHVVKVRNEVPVVFVTERLLEMVCQVVEARFRFVCPQKINSVSRNA